MTPPPTHDEQNEQLAAYLGRTRWFGGKGRPFRVSGSVRAGVLPGVRPDGPAVVVHVIRVTYEDAATDTADAQELYQVPLACYAEPQQRLEHALVGRLDDAELGRVHAYDAVHDREAADCWLRAFSAAEGSSEDQDRSLRAEGAPLRFHRLPGHELDLSAHSTLFTGEQSNSSMTFGEDALLKVFRKVTPGVNPDVQVHEVLTRADSHHVARLYGWLDLDAGVLGEAVLGESDGEKVVQLAMLQEYLRTASDGWELAQASVRDLFHSDDLHAREVGGDFSGESSRLGASVLEVHGVLADAFGREELTGDAVRRLSGAMHDRLAGALAAVPELAPYAGALRALYDQVAALEAVTVQRVHGDLHLGQTLRTVDGWKLVDFEGEPARPLRERLLPDSPWRDVAGMLRSFDYAPHVVERTMAENDADYAGLLHDRAEEWANRNRNHFLTGYVEGMLADTDRVLLAAYEADKAVYETVYETRNRPGWVSIPLAAVARIEGAA